MIASLLSRSFYHILVSRPKLISPPVHPSTLSCWPSYTVLRPVCCAEKRKDERRLYNLTRQIFPLAKALLIYLSTKDQILYVSHKTSMIHKSARQSACCFVHLSVSQPVRSRISQQVQSLYVTHSVSQAVNESVPESILHSCLSCTPVLDPFKPFSPLAVRRHPANCCDKGLSKGITIY